MELAKNNRERMAQINSFDKEALLWVNGLATISDEFNVAVQIIASDYLIMTLYAAVMFGMWFAGRNSVERASLQRASLIAAASIGISNIGVTILNGLWDRPRPYVELVDQLNMLFYRPTDPSFPANPVAVAFAAATAAYLANNKLGWMLIAGASIYGLSRIYVGASFPTDIIGGAAVGLTATLISQLLFTFGKPISEIAIRILRGIAAA